jgi:hypothetical protein
MTTDNDELTRARETNTRLNRRLGSMEHDLHSLVSQAQHRTNEAQRSATDAQRLLGEANRNWFRSIDREAMTSFVAAGFMLAFSVTLVWAITVTIILVLS